jgi:hypothetical protein
MGREHGKTTRKKIQKEGQKIKKECMLGKNLKGRGTWGRHGRRFGRKDKREKNIHVGKGAKREGIMGKTTRKKVLKGRQKRKRNTRRRRS